MMASDDVCDLTGEDFGFRCCAMLIIITSMPTSSVYRVMSERIIMYVKIMTR